MNVAIIGATGLVGTTMLKLLSERGFPIDALYPVASDKSIGQQIAFNEDSYTIISIEDALASKPDLALFSAGSDLSLKWAERFAAEGCFVIDNSSAWRMNPSKKLIVPEVNGHLLAAEDKIIANPNCSTIQMVMILKPIHDRYQIKRVVVSTYQSVTGSGQKGVDQLWAERQGKIIDRFYPHQIDLNLIPHIDVFQENGYTKEEMKMILETQKIMGDEQIKVTATAVRVPVMGGHSESVNIELHQDFNVNDIKIMLSEAKGVVLLDDVQDNIYPMPLDAFGKDEVYVGRVRRDESQPNTLNCWIVADNLRKGAATNAVQIAEYLLDKGFIGKNEQ